MTQPRPQQTLPDVEHPDNNKYQNECFEYIPSFYSHTELYSVQIFD